MRARAKEKKSQFVAGSPCLRIRAFLAARGRLCRVMVTTALGAGKAEVAARVKEAIDEAVADNAAANVTVIYNSSLVFWEAMQGSLHEGDWAALLPVVTTVADGMIRAGQRREWAAQLAVTAAKAQEASGDMSGAVATLEAAWVPRHRPTLIVTTRTRAAISIPTM